MHDQGMSLRAPLLLASFFSLSPLALFLNHFLALPSQKAPQRIQITLKLCVSALKRMNMHTVVQATPSNDLSSELFVFKVLEDMMSRGMYGLAEDVVSYVGVGRKVT
jgi:hypothetical protein